MTSTPAKRWSTRRAVAVVAVGLLVASGAGAFAYWTYAAGESANDSYATATQGLEQTRAERARAQADHDERLEAEATAQREAQQRAAEAEAERIMQETRDANFAADGFDHIGNNVYFRWAERDEYSCGRYDCIAFSVIAHDGCPGGLYLEAAIMRDGTQVDWTNETFSAIPQYGSASGFFEDIFSQGDSFQLTEANCR
ncbi:hypothetical protein [Demequina sp.]|uniref:hypothetical protein n=1 Tax=Demequina sp. TaxID=2050685 RepID=UPI003A84DFC9